MFLCLDIVQAALLRLLCVGSAGGVLFNEGSLVLEISVLGAIVCPATVGAEFYDVTFSFPGVDSSVATFMTPWRLFSLCRLAGAALCGVLAGALRDPGAFPVYPGSPVGFGRSGQSADAVGGGVAGSAEHYVKPQGSAVVSVWIDIGQYRFVSALSRSPHFSTHRHQHDRRISPGH